MGEVVSAARIEAAMVKVAKLVEADRVYGPIFDRLEADHREAVARESKTVDVQDRARSLLRQSAMGRRRSAT